MCNVLWQLTRAPMNLASSNSCLRGSSAAWKWCSILTLAPKRNTKPVSEKLSTNQLKNEYDEYHKYNDFSSVYLLDFWVDAAQRRRVDESA